jgi:hypothetical protein
LELDESELLNETDLTMNEYFLNNHLKKIQINIKKQSSNYRQEVMKTFAPFIFKYLNKFDLVRLNLVDKLIGRECLVLLLNEVNIENEKNQQKLKELSEKFTKIELNKPFPDYTPAKGALRAIELLNNNIHMKLFTESTLPNTDVIIIYRIFFQLLNHEIASYKDDNDFWKECCSFFKTTDEQKIGEKIISQIISFDFSSINVNKISRLLINRPNIVTPGYFSNVCGTTGIIIFLVRDCLEYCGIVNDRIIYPSRLYLNCLYEQELIRVQKRRLNYMLKSYKI